MGGAITMKRLMLVWVMILCVSLGVASAESMRGLIRAKKAVAPCMKS